MSAKPAFEIVVPDSAEYVDTSLATASWWDRHEIKPGTYPGTYIGSGTQAWASLESVVVEEYRVNRVFEHSAAQRSTPNRPGSVSVMLYPYEVVEGRKVLGGVGYVRLTEARQD